MSIALLICGLLCAFVATYLSAKHQGYNLLAWGAFSIAFILLAIFLNF